MNEDVAIRRGIITRVVQILITVLIFGLCLFLSAWKMDWVMAWVYLGVYAAGVVFNTSVILHLDPELVAERSKLITPDTKKWDLLLARYVSLYGPMSILIVAGLDEGRGWQPKAPPALQFGALALLVVGSLLVTWSMASNHFFAGFVRIQKERGHTVASGGPYQYVRHPGYLGIGVHYLGTAFFLGSVWALIPAVVAICVLILRTTLEDRTLQMELEGYREYTQRVRWRLVPGLW